MQLKPSAWLIALALIVAGGLLAYSQRVAAKNEESRLKRLAQSCLIVAQARSFASPLTHLHTGKLSLIEDIWEQARLLRQSTTAAGHSAASKPDLVTGVMEILQSADRLNGQAENIQTMAREFDALYKQIPDLTEAAKKMHAEEMLAPLSSPARMAAAGMYMMLVERQISSLAQIMTMTQIDPRVVFELRQAQTSFRSLSEALEYGNAQMKIAPPTSRKQKETWATLVKQFEPLEATVQTVLSNLLAAVTVSRARVEIAEQVERINLLFREDCSVVQ
jgi:hypothetical protein